MMSAWIAVGDWLPDAGETVLVWHTAGGAGAGHIDPEMDEWMDDSGDFIDITHWMMLPDPPKDRRSVKQLIP